MHRIGVLTLCIIMASASVEDSVKKVRPLARAEVVDVWIGFSSDDIHFYRCDLFENGKGTFVDVFTTEDASAYEIEQWLFEEKQIQIRLDARDLQNSGITDLRGSLKLNRWQMDMEIVGTDWKKTATLYRANDLHRRESLAINALGGKSGARP